MNKGSSTPLSLACQSVVVEAAAAAAAALGSSYKYRIPGSTPDPLNQNLRLHNLHWYAVCTSQLLFEGSDAQSVLPGPAASAAPELIRNLKS